MPGRRDDEQLMAYLDGELAPKEARAVEERLASSEDARAKVEAMKELSAVLRGHYEAETEKVEPRLASMWARIESQLGDPEPARADERRGAWAAIREWFDAYRGHVLVGAACAAAGALIAMQVQEPREIVRERVVEMKVPVEAAPPVEMATARGEATTVDGIDVQGGRGMVFRVPADSEEEAPITVIWVERQAPRGPEGPI